MQVCPPAGLEARTVKLVMAGGVALVVLMVSVDVPELVPLGKLIDAGLNEKVTPVGWDGDHAGMQRAAVKFPPAALFTVTKYDTLPPVPEFKLPLWAPTAVEPTFARFVMVSVCVPEV